MKPKKIKKEFDEAPKKRKREHDNDYIQPKKVFKISEDDGLCMLCRENEKDTYVYPCGHLIICSECSDNTQKIKSFKNTCIYCNQNIKKIIYLNESNKELTLKNDEIIKPKCKLCEINVVETIVEPCGHICLCEECSLKIPRDNYLCKECGEKVLQVSYIKSSKIDLLP